MIIKAFVRRHITVLLLLLLHALLFFSETPTVSLRGSQLGHALGTWFTHIDARTIYSLINSISQLIAPPLCGEAEHESYHPSGLPRALFICQVSMLVHCLDAHAAMQQSRI